MHPLEQLKIMSKTSYQNYEGEQFHIKLKKGLSTKKINQLKKHLPNKKLTKELEELLKYASGFETPRGFLDEINFDNFGDSWLKELVPYSLRITNDGIGGCWIQEINRKGELGKVYLVGHDPAVLIKQAENLTEFLLQIHDYLLKEEASFFSKVYNEISMEVYFGKGKLLEQDEAVKSTDKLLSGFAANYNKDWFIADLRKAKNGEGFRLEASYKETIRLGDELIWAVKKYKYKSFWKKLKEKFRQV